MASEVQTITMVRHGQGFHNVAGERDRNEYRSYKYFDAHLTETGWRQALSLRSRLRELHLTPDVVVVSPLTRTLETATGVYGGEPLRDEREDTGHEGILMAPQEEDPGVRTGCPGFSSANAPPFVANELCREGFGRHPCDKRRPVSDAQRRFPGVVEWVVETDEDTWYDEELREPPDNVLRRAREFLAWLQRRPESNLAVVSHAEFLGTLSFVLAHGVSDAAARDALTATFANCEARVVEVRRGGGQGDVPSVTLKGVPFPGGVESAKEMLPWSVDVVC